MEVSQCFCDQEIICLCLISNESDIITIDV